MGNIEVRGPDRQPAVDIGAAAPGGADEAQASSTAAEAAAGWKVPVEISTPAGCPHALRVDECGELVGGVHHIAGIIEVRFGAFAHRPRPHITGHGEFLEAPSIDMMLLILAGLRVAWVRVVGNALGVIGGKGSPSAGGRFGGCRAFLIRPMGTDIRSLTEILRVPVVAGVPYPVEPAVYPAVHGLQVGAPLVYLLLGPAVDWFAQRGTGFFHDVLGGEVQPAVEDVDVTVLQDVFPRCIVSGHQNSGAAGPAAFGQLLTRAYPIFGVRPGVGDFG